MDGARGLDRRQDAMTVSMNLADWIEANGGVKDNFGKTWYVAEIVGPHEKYNLERDFISYKTGSSYSGKTGSKAVDVDDLKEGAVYEIRGDSWGNKHRRLVRVLTIDEREDAVGLQTETLEDDEDALAALAEPA